MKGPDFTDRSVFAWGPPLDLFARMRAEAPVCWSDAPPDWEIEKGYDRFDVRRTRCRHQAFGPGGPHFCLGAGLARLELRVAFEEILRRMPDIEAAGTPDRIHSNLVAGYRRMPVRFTPGARSNPA